MAHARGQLSMGRQQGLAYSSASTSPALLQPVPSPSRMMPSPKRPRLETTDAHQSPTDCDLGSPGDQHRKATVLPVIHIDEEPDLPTCATPRESSADSDEHFDKPSSSPGVVNTAADQVRTDADSCPRNDDKKTPADRNLSVEDN